MGRGLMIVLAVLVSATLWGAAITICKGSMRTPRPRGAKWSINTSDGLISSPTSLPQ